MEEKDFSKKKPDPVASDCTVNRPQRMSLKPRRVDFEPTWQTLLSTVQGVITCGHVARSTWNDRFSDVYKLCVACPDPLGDRLYNETKDFLERHVKHLHQLVLEAGEENLLATYFKHWDHYSKGSGYLNQLFGYLNTTYIKKHKFSEADINYGGFNVEQTNQMLEIGELALDTWKNLMIEPLRSHLVNLVLGEIQRDRQGGSVNQAVVHGVITSFVNVEEYKKKNSLYLYESMFEKPFLKQTGDHYRKEAAKLKDENTCSEYMEKVIHRLDNENFRSRKFLHGSSYSKVTAECQQRMVADHLQFLHGECREMVQMENRKDLKNMYVLLKPIHSALGMLVQEVELHIRHTGMMAVTNLKGDSIPQLFVESMLNVHGRFSELIQSVFQSDQQFMSALDKACAAAINHRPNPKVACRSPELLARYCDSLLKKSSKGFSEGELDDKLSSCITVFKYLDDKDVFQRFYSRMLCKRLIYCLSTSMDAEEAMINKLKQACGYEFTNKLHRMFTDMTISSDLNTKFSQFLKEGEDRELGLNFSMLVLQAGAWPIGQSNLPSFVIPQELEKCVSTYETFYSSQYNGRKLTWMHHFCTGELKFNYLKKPYIVTVGTFHMAILLLFNNTEALAVRDIMEHTQMTAKEVVRHVQALVDTKILVAEEEVTSDSVMTLNMAYTNKRTKFKITSVVQKDTPQEVESTHSSVEEDRKMYLQAAIVRIMKARKKLKHTLLIQEVITQSKSRFNPHIPMIKKCIESLIDKQYLERVANTPDEYHYVA